MTIHTITFRLRSRTRTNLAPNSRRTAKLSSGALHRFPGAHVRRVPRWQQRKAHRDLRLALLDARNDCELSSQQCQRICGSRLRGSPACSMAAHCDVSTSHAQLREGGAYEGQ